MEIRAKSRFDYDSVKALTHLWMFKRADPKKRMVFWTIADLVLLAVILLEIILFGSDIVLFVLMGAVAAMYLLECYMYFLLPKIKYNSLAKMKDVENEYVFREEKIDAYTKSEAYSGQAEIKYALLVKVMETSKYLFLYQNNTQVFIVDKSTIVGGTAEEIRNKLSSVTGNRYIICKY